MGKVAAFLISWRGDFVLPWLHFQALHHMKPRRERSDDVDPGKLEGISSSFRAHGNEGLLPVSDQRWIVHEDS